MNYSNRKPANNIIRACFSLREHTVSFIHLVSLVWLGSHIFPLYLGAGFSHLLIRWLLANLHGLSGTSHSDHSLHPPCPVKKESVTQNNLQLLALNRRYFLIAVGLEFTNP